MNGWVKNTGDGAVEATVSGSDGAVEEFINWCWKGPEEAVVKHVQVTPKPDDGFSGFTVIP